MPTALLSLFRAATLEDWTDIMYINMYGCDKYPSGQYVIGTAEALTASKVPKMFQCASPEASPALSPVYWVLFVMVSISLCDGPGPSPPPPPRPSPPRSPHTNPDPPDASARPRGRTRTTVSGVLVCHVEPFRRCHHPGNERFHRGADQPAR